MATCMVAECPTTRCGSIVLPPARHKSSQLHATSSVDLFFMICLCPTQGPILAAVYAVKEMQEVGKELAFNVAFVFEGEEENGSKVTLA